MTSRLVLFLGITQALNFERRPTTLNFRNGKFVIDIRIQEAKLHQNNILVKKSFCGRKWLSPYHHHLLATKCPPQRQFWSKLYSLKKRLCGSYSYTHCNLELTEK